MSNSCIAYDYSIDELKSCLREAARLWNRPITPLDVRICEDMFLNYGFDPDTVYYLLSFAKMRGADTLNYLYPIADVLKKRKIRTKTEAELTLEKSFKKYMDILVYINWDKTVPSQAEKEKIDEIFQTYTPSDEEIRIVGEITRKAKRPSLRYFETVLKNKRDTERSVCKEESLPKRVYPERDADTGIPFQEEFEQIKLSVKEEAGLSDLAYNAWIKDLKVAKSAEKEIEICIPGHDDRFLHFIEKKYKSYFEGICRRKGVQKEILFTISPQMS